MDEGAELALECNESKRSNFLTPCATPGTTIETYKIRNPNLHFVIFISFCRWDFSTQSNDPQCSHTHIYILNVSITDRPTTTIIYCICSAPIITPTILAIWKVHKEFRKGFYLQVYK